MATLSLTRPAAQDRRAALTQAYRILAAEGVTPAWLRRAFPDSDLALETAAAAETPSLRSVS